MKQNPSLLRKERSKVLEIMPMIGSVGLYLKHEVDDRLPFIAGTDGKTVKFQEDYFKLPFAERNGILLHEYMHVALSHNQRGSIVAKKEGKDYDGMLMNISMDMFINKGIESQYKNSNFIKLPEWAVRWEIVAKEIIVYNIAMAGTPWQSVNLPDYKETTCEKVYAILKLIKESASNCQKEYSKQNKTDLKENDQDKNDQGKNNSDSKVENDNKPPTSKQEEAANKILKKLQTFRDVEEILEKSFSELNHEIEKGRAKIENSIQEYGHKFSDLIEKIKGDIPSSQVPWQNEFRSRTQKHLSRERIKHHSRPARSILSQIYVNNKSIIWNPGRKRIPVPRAALIMDSSGSILMETYKAYLAEIQGLIKRTNAEVTVIVADAEIQEIYQIRTINDIQKITFVGRGGTDFRPALKWIDEQGYDLAIYLTDLMGAFPEKTKTPVLWVGPENPYGTNKKAPIGRTIWIKQ